MSHNCQNLVINCLDFRLQESLVNFLTGLGLTNDYDLISVAGGALALAHPKEKRDRDFIFEQIAIAAEKHKIERIFVINHEDCGAYGGSAKFGNDKIAEQEFHDQELKKAKAEILAKFPDQEVVLIYAKFTNSGKISHLTWLKNSSLNLSFEILS